MSEVELSGIEMMGVEMFNPHQKKNYLCLLKRNQLHAGFIKLRIQFNSVETTPPITLRSTSRMLLNKLSECLYGDEAADPHESIASSNTDFLQESLSLYPVLAQGVGP